MSDLATRQCSKVFIGGLSWETTGEKLRAYFENYGVVREAFVSYNRNNGRPRGFGFVVFESPEVADKVVATKHTIDRREVEAKKAVPKDEHLDQEQQQSVNASSREDGASAKSKKIFVGGLAPSVDDKVLRQYFETFGAVEDAVVMYDHDNKRPRGFGFVTFAAEDSVELVFAKGAMQCIQDKQIEIKSAVPRDQMPPTATRPPAAPGFFDPRFGARGLGAGAAYPQYVHGPGIPSQFSNLPRGYGPGPRNFAPSAQQPGPGGGRGPGRQHAGAQGMQGFAPHHAAGTGRGQGMHSSDLSTKVPPMPGNYDIYAAGTLNSSHAQQMFASANSQAALAYLQQQVSQAQLNGMHSAANAGAAAAAGKLNAAAAFRANNLNLKALALASGFGAAFPGGGHQGADSGGFQDESGNFQQQHSDADYAEAAAAAVNLNAAAGLGVTPDFNYHDASFNAAPAPGWSS